MIRNKDVLLQHFSRHGFGANVIKKLDVRQYIHKKTRQRIVYAIATLASRQMADQFIRAMSGSYLFGKHRLILKPYEKRKQNHKTTKQKTTKQKTTHKRASKKIESKQGFPASSRPVKPVVQISSGLRVNYGDVDEPSSSLVPNSDLTCQVSQQSQENVLDGPHTNLSEQSNLSHTAESVYCPERTEELSSVAELNPASLNESTGNNVTLVTNTSCHVTTSDAVPFSGDNNDITSTPATDRVPKTSCKRKKVKSSEKIIPTKVKFEVSCSTTEQQFRNHVNHLLKQEITCKILQIQNGSTASEVEVEFQSLSKAKHVLKLLMKRDPSMKGTISKPKSPLIDAKKMIAEFKANIEKKKTLFIQEHTKELDKLRQKHQKLVLPKKCNLDLHTRIVAERKGLNQAIVERTLQQVEFESHCKELQTKLSQLDLPETADKETLEAEVSQMRKNFGIECVHFSRRLPIYACRTDIIKTVQEYQVSILIGETGSGKSTQIVQYLYGAGFSKRGAIVCTQPRKVAAISLADYVSREMGEVVGQVLGYKTGARGKFSKITEVFYMTDHTLLNECIADPTFAKYSCLVIDEAHERSLSTDILLAFVKQSLHTRTDLRVIITSATIDPALFKEYFGGECPVINVSGRTYPVEVVWNPLKLVGSPIERQYVSDAVKLACQLHDCEPLGDILVFLTNPLEIEKACQQTTEKVGNGALVLPLHGKLQPEDQRKVFEDNEKRKIIFATNIAETSVTIPGVKCVVDTGLAKELCFDPKKNLNSLEVRIISKSSAEQRKGRAGRTSAGKCYRLYSEKVHQDMPDKMLPEILRVALSSAALKLYEFGVKDILSFDFVEQPDQTALKTAVESLVFLGAVKDHRLTDLGKKMASLPTDPHLSKILLDGIDEGVSIEAATAVAISILAGSVFFRAGNEEVKNESDMKTITFCHPTGDQMTYIQTYQQWASQDKANQNKWCVENFVNAKSMRLIKECVRELCDILSSKFHIHFPQNINQLNLEEAEAKIPKLYFNVFIKNLCVFLGHERVGYLNERLPKEKLIIFPGSPLRQLNVVPEVVVYEKTLKTSQNFMLQVLPVKEEWIQEAIATGKIPLHPCQSGLFHHFKVTPLIFENLGYHVLSTLQNGRQDINKELEAEHIEPLLEFLRKEGMLKVFLPKHCHESVSMLLQAHISSIRDELEKEIDECGVTSEDDNVRVLVGCGGSIQRVLMPHEYRTVVIKGPKNVQWQDSIYQQLLEYGNIQKHWSSQVKNQMHLSVTFLNPDDAKNAATSLETPKDVCIEPMLLLKSGDAQTTFSLTIEWCRRERKDFAFIEFREEDDFVHASACLRSVYLHGSIAKIRPSKDGKPQLFVTCNGARFLTKEQIKQAILCNLPHLEEDSLDVSLGFEKSFETTPKMYDDIKDELDRNISQCATKGKYKLNVDRSQRSHSFYRARVVFQIPIEGQTTSRRLQYVLIGGKPLSVEASLSSVVRFPPAVYKVIEKSVEAITEEIHFRYNTVKVQHGEKDKGGKVRIRISSDNVKDFNIAKYALHTVINPEKIECRNPILREYIYTTNCKESLEKIRNETDTYIRVDYRTVTISIYGSQGNISRAQIEFNKSLSFLDDGTKCHEIQLKKPGMPPGLMKHLVVQFGQGLQGIVERDGIYSARLNPRKQILAVFATEAAYQSIIELVKEYSLNLNPHLQGVHHSPEDVECCVCLTPIDNVSDIIRLELCGHPYCCDCIQTQVAPSNISIPVLCAADECSKPLVLKDFQNLFKRVGFKLQRLVKASLRAYVAANPDLVHVCPSPDCEMVYNVTKDGQSFFCSHCSAITCTTCHEPYHAGLSCVMYQSEIVADEGVRKWMESDPENRKRCPKCRTIIEKTYGCNHVHCTTCNVHVCWFCSKYFNTSIECYDHMSKQHGNIGLPPE